MFSFDAQATVIFTLKFAFDFTPACFLTRPCLCFLLKKLRCQHVYMIWNGKNKCYFLFVKNVTVVETDKEIQTRENENFLSDFTDFTVIVMKACSKIRTLGLWTLDELFYRHAINKPLRCYKALTRKILMSQLSVVYEGVGVSHE